jgi:hypothetical protein
MAISKGFNGVFGPVDGPGTLTAISTLKRLLLGQN